MIYSFANFEDQTIRNKTLNQTWFEIATTSSKVKIAGIYITSWIPGTWLDKLLTNTLKHQIYLSWFHEFLQYLKGKLVKQKLIKKSNCPVLIVRPLKKFYGYAMDNLTARFSFIGETFIRKWASKTQKL